MSNTLLVHSHIALTDAEAAQLEEAYKNGVPAPYDELTIEIAEQAIKEGRVEVIAAEEL